MHFRVLGPLRAYVGEDEVVLSAGRERTLLAMLLLHLGETVPVARLVDAIWGDRPPQDARNQVQVCVSRLRRRLSRAGMPSDVIVTDPAGYRAEVERDHVDLWEFRRLTAEARSAAANEKLAEARDLYRGGLALWRGPAISGIDSELVADIATTLEEQHVQAVEECAEIEIALGATGELVAELADLARTYPYRERVHGALMLALYRTGRYADALAAYRRLREVLHDELGVEPGAEVQRLHSSILNRDPELDPPRDPPGDLPLRPVPVPRQLPAEATRFVGREQEVVGIRRTLATAVRDTRRSPAVMVLYGPGGVGKSALAVRVAHDLAGEFPDGHLYVDLYGSTPGILRQPTGEVLGRFLYSLGVPQGEIPPGEAEAAALLRTVTTGRRVLMVLDNAADREQIASLMPSSPTCAVLVTSRQPLPTLDADDRLRVDRLPEPDALALLTRLTGGREMDAAAAQSIVASCDGLPLAVRIAAGRLASRPDLPAHEYAAALADRSRRLDELQLDDLAVRACIRTGYDALVSGGGPGEQLAARVFRALGLLQVPDVAPDVVAAMLAEPRSDAPRAALDRLVDAQLLEPVRSGRYRLHDLVRLVAAERAVAEEEATERDAAFGRAVAFYTGSLRNAMGKIRPARVMPFGEPSLADDVSSLSFGTLAEARTWADDELPSLGSVLASTAPRTDQSGRLALWLGELLWMSLDARCEWQAASRVSRLVLEAATRGSDQELLACGHLLEGRSEACLARYESALEHLEQAEKVLRQLGNLPGVAIALNGRGLTHVLHGAYSMAHALYVNALDLAHRLDLPDLTASVLSNMSVCHLALGQLDQALAAAERSASWIRKTGAVATIGVMNLAGVHTTARDRYVDVSR